MDDHWLILFKMRTNNPSLNGLGKSNPIHLERLEIRNFQILDAWLNAHFNR